MGLGITTLLDGAVTALRTDTPTKPGLIHSLWVVSLVFLHVTTWLFRWRAGGRPSWTFGDVLMFLYLPVMLYALARLAFPTQGREVNLTTYLLENRRTFFGVLSLVYIGMSIGPRLFFEGGRADPAFDPLWILTVVPFLWLLAWTSNKKVHLALAVFWVFLTFIDFARNTPFAA